MVSQGFSNSATSSSTLLASCQRAPSKRLMSGAVAAALPTSHLLSNMTSAMAAAGSYVDPNQQRSPLMCGYPSKKCWNWRVEKRNGELHKFCQYHREKANENQRRMEQRKKNGIARAARANGLATAASSTTPRAAHVKKPTQVQTSHAYDKPAMKTSPRSVDGAIDGAGGMVDWNQELLSQLECEMDLEMDLAVDLAGQYMLPDESIDLELSDVPMDLYQEDLEFLEHFIEEISHSPSI